MEKRVSFEFDGREIARSIMNERIVKEKSLNERIHKSVKLEIIRRKCNWLKNEWEKEYETKITYEACANGNVKFNIYANEYDYYSVSIMIDEYTTMSEIINIITFMLENRIEELDFYKAPTIEKVIVDMLEENECENIYIMDGTLIYEGLEFCLEDINEFHVYNDEECLMRIYDEYIIDFEKDVIEEECEV
ncbi:MAG: hypothetical protein RSE41_06100 [Clostridia bacterium]